MANETKGILLVEDEAIIAMMEKQQLEKIGYSVSVVGNGEGAIEMALGADSAFDAILMDIDLGSGIDGTQAAARILISKDIPIIFVSSHIEPEIVRKTENISSYGYVVKNSGIVVLDASIKMALKLFNEKMERQQAERQVLQLKSLYATRSQINQAIVRVGTQEELAGEVSRIAVQFGLFRLAWVGRHNEKTREVTPIGHAGEPATIVHGMKHTSDATAEHPCLCGPVIREDRSCVINHLSSATTTYSLQQELLEAGINAAGVFPIRVKGKVWGVFGVYADEPGIFQDKEVALLEEAAMDIGYAVEKMESDERRQQAEKSQQLSAAVLSMLNEPMTLHETSRAILRLIKSEFDLDAVGIRLKDDNDFPYFSEEGFTEDFLLAENSLVLRSENGTVCRDPDGQICLECTCGLVLTEKCGPPSEYVTPTGSLWTNDSLAASESMRGSDPRLKPRDRCVHDGFLSVALIPIRADQRIIGLLHLNDRRADRFTPESIRFFEGLTASFGIAVERKRSEQALQASEERFRFALAHAPVSVAVQGLDQRYTWAYNQRTRKPDEIVGKTDFDLSPQDAERLVALKRRVLESGESTSEQMWITSNGKRVFLNLYIEPLKNERGEVDSLGLATVDLTDQKQAEEEIKRQLMEKETVLKEVHHRIKNSIASIEGLLSMQANASDNDDVRIALRESIARIQTTRVLYEKLLISKDHRVVSTKNYIESLVESLIAVFPDHKNVSINLDIADIAIGSNVMVTVGIIINELITNIFKYAFIGRDGGHVSIVLENAGNILTLTIKDDGIGIARGTAVNAVPGFGLTLVSMLAEQLKGTFTMNEENGTRATLRFAM